MQDESAINDYMEMFKDDLNKALAFQKNEYLIIRAGRANPHILDKVMVEYYGTMTPITQMANISVPEARMLVINVWDIGQVRNVSKAISMADLGVQPSDDGKVIRLVFPALTEERRKEIVKQVRKIMEDTKVTMRNARRDVLDAFKQMKKDGEISEDEMSGLEKDVQRQLDNFSEIVESTCAAKEKEILEL